MSNSVIIQGHGLSSFLLAKLLERYSDFSFSWEGYFLENIPVYMNPSLYRKIYSLIPVLEDIVIDYPIYYNGKKDEGILLGTKKLNGYSRGRDMQNPYIASSVLQEKEIYLSDSGCKYLLNFYSCQTSLEYGIYEFYTPGRHPYYMFLFSDKKYVAYYMNEEKPFTKNNDVIVDEKIQFQFSTGVTMLPIHKMKQSESLYFGAAIGFIPFFLGQGNMIACIDALHIFLFLTTRNQSYLDHLYAYRRKVMNMTRLLLAKNPYTLTAYNLEEYLNKTLDAILKIFNSSIVR